MSAYDIVLCNAKGRSAEQQDAIALGDRVIQATNHLSQHLVESDEVLLAIADGVATSQGAARASRTVLNELISVMRAHSDWCADGQINGRHIRAVQQRLCNQLAGKRSSYGASTTIVAAHLVAGRLAVVNVGDSQVYVRRSNGEIQQLSRDHTELEKLRIQGRLVEGRAYASVYDSLSDCLVADPEEVEFQLHRETAQLGPGDLLILCSDGVHEVLGEPVWHQLIAEATSPMDLATRTRAAVLGARSPDNFSLLVGTAVE